MSLPAGANISRPTFYFYFDSRDAVVRALAERVTQELFDTAVSSIDDNQDGPTAVLHRIASAYMQRWRREGPLLRAMVTLGESDPEHRAFWNEVTGRIRRHLAESIEGDRRAGRALPGPPSAAPRSRRHPDEHDVALRLRPSLSPPSEEADARMADTLAAVSMRAIYGQSPGLGEDGPQPGGRGDQGPG